MPSEKNVESFSSLMFVNGSTAMDLSAEFAGTNSVGGCAAGRNTLRCAVSWGFGRRKIPPSVSAIAPTPTQTQARRDLPGGPRSREAAEEETDTDLAASAELGPPAA